MEEEESEELKVSLLLEAVPATTCSLLLYPLSSVPFSWVFANLFLYSLTSLFSSSHCNIMCVKLCNAKRIILAHIHTLTLQIPLALTCCGNNLVLCKLNCTNGGTIGVSSIFPSLLKPPLVLFLFLETVPVASFTGRIQNTTGKKASGLWSFTCSTHVHGYTLVGIFF